MAPGREVVRPWGKSLAPGTLRSQPVTSSAVLCDLCEVTSPLWPQFPYLLIKSASQEDIVGVKEDKGSEVTLQGFSKSLTQTMGQALCGAGQRGARFLQGTCHFLSLHQGPDVRDQHRAG